MLSVNLFSYAKIFLSIDMRNFLQIFLLLDNAALEECVLFLVLADIPESFIAIINTIKAFDECNITMAFRYQIRCCIFSAFIGIENNTTKMYDLEYYDQ